MASMICASSTLSEKSSLVKRMRITNSMHPPSSRLNPNSSIKVSCVQHLSCKNKFISVESSTKSSFFKGDNAAFSSLSLIPKISRVSTAKSSSFTAIKAHQREDDRRSIYQFSVKLNGKDVSLYEYARKVLLIVNIPEQGSQYTDDEYAFLHDLLDEFQNGNPGLEILGFLYDKSETSEHRIPGGPDEKILRTAHFPIFDKVILNKNKYKIWQPESWLGESKLWSHLKNKDKGGEDITEEFEKFLISSDGIPLSRYKPFPKVAETAGPQDGGMPTSRFTTMPSDRNVIKKEIKELIGKNKVDGHQQMY